MIKISGLTKHFDHFTAVDHLSFEVSPGEVLGFLGPNGAGKSTTMKMITGFLAPSAGSISVCGHDVISAPLQAQRLMGYLPEGAPAYGDMRVGAFLRFVAEIRGYRGDELRRRVAATVKQIELEGVINQPIDTLSKGFKRRVGLAQAILHDPQVLVMDEPTDGLDPNQKHHVRELIRNLSKDKIVIISTHILEEVHAVCSRALIIAAGKIVADGTPSDLATRSRYHQAVTLRFVGATPAADEFKALANVERIETDEHSGLVTLFPRGKESLLQDVNQLILARGWAVEEFHVEKGRLDDVFREITTGVAA